MIGWLIPIPNLLPLHDDFRSLRAHSLGFIEPLMGFGIMGVIYTKGTLLIIGAVFDNSIVYPEI